MNKEGSIKKQERSDISSLLQVVLSFIIVILIVVTAIFQGQVNYYQNKINHLQIQINIDTLHIISVLRGRINTLENLLLENNITVLPWEIEPP